MRGRESDDVAGHAYPSKRGLGQSPSKRGLGQSPSHFATFVHFKSQNMRRNMLKPGRIVNNLLPDFPVVLHATLLNRYMVYPLHDP